MAGEERLRELLRDPRWSLPPWPDAELRVRRTARRQRMRFARIGGAVAAVVTTAAVLPVMALARNPGGPTASGGPAAPTPGVHLLALPALGAPGFPVGIYPAARRAVLMTAAMPLCPANSGLQVPNRNTAVVAVIELRQQGRSFAADLRGSDRAYWPGLLRGWRQDPVKIAAQAADMSVTYSGPLADFQVPARPSPPVRARTQAAASAQVPVVRHALAGVAAPVSRRTLTSRQAPVNAAGRVQTQAVRQPPAALRLRLRAVAGIVAAGCGAHLVRHSWVVVSRRPRAPASGRLAPVTPAREVASLFLKRRGHLLLYTSQ